MNMPRFMPWTSWVTRYDIKDCERPGVYLLGKFDSQPPAEVDSISAPVIYIGETCDQNLAQRWYQFNRSAFEQKPGHSGGWTFSGLYCDNRIVEPVGWLYVAALPMTLQEPHSSAYIRFVRAMADMGVRSEVQWLASMQL